MQVDFDRHSLRIDGVRRLIRAGSLHYFRLPAPELWRDRIAKMRDAGLNAVDVYYPWNYHSSQAGEYDFTGIRDVDLLHDMIEEAGLALIARPGPYICAEIDAGGMPAWLLQDPSVFLRCRVDGDYTYSLGFLAAAREWFEAIVPRFAGRRNLCLVQIENEYTVPTPLSGLSSDLVDLLVRWFGTPSIGRVLGNRLLRRLLMPTSPLPDGERGQRNSYMHELYDMMREFGVTVPVFHNDLAPGRGRQMDVDIPALDRYPIVGFDRDWRDDPATFDVFRGDEAALDAHGKEAPVFYPELQGGWYDGWGGRGYGRVRELLGPDGIDGATKAALAERATLFTYYVFCGGVTWGYMASPDVYSSYDYGAPIGETGHTGARYEAVRQLNGFLERFEEDLCQTERIDGEPWCPEHLISRQGPKRRFVFLRNASRQPRRVAMPEAERATLAPWETQIRVYGSTGELEAVSPPPVDRISPPTGQPVGVLPALDRWTFCGTSPQLNASYDDAGWSEIPAELIDLGEIDIDTLGVHYGFIWYRGTYHRPLERLVLDARHCWAAWVNRVCVGAGDQLRNTRGVGPDGARSVRIPVRSLPHQEGRNALVIAVESLGHNKAFADDARNPRGLVRIDTGGTPISWRYRGGLMRGERGLTPIVALEGAERTAAEEVALPHSWGAEGPGVALFETRFRTDGIDPERTQIGVVFDPGRGKANLYLNGYLLGRYWPERGPQRRFPLPWGVLRPDQENQLAVAVWKRTPEAVLGRVRLEVM